MAYKEHFLNAATAVLVLCAVVVTSVVVRREFFSPEPAPHRYAAVTNWADYAEDGHRSGPADASVTIVTFSDFQCPACRVLETNLQLLQARHPDRVAVVYRHLPLASHPFAIAAARASECAAAQQRFQEYRNALYARQDSIGVASWARFAVIADVPDLDPLHALRRARRARSRAGPGHHSGTAAGGLPHPDGADQPVPDRWRAPVGGTRTISFRGRADRSGPRAIIRA